ncbi:AraC family transcriptional regulator [bacterium]
MIIIALNATPFEWDVYQKVKLGCSMIGLVEKMIMFIARNNTQPLKNEDIGKSVGLHPDYVNTIFKKSFGMTLNQYINLQRILH